MYTNHEIQDVCLTITPQHVRSSLLFISSNLHQQTWKTQNILADGPRVISLWPRKASCMSIITTSRCKSGLVLEIPMPFWGGVFTSALDLDNASTSRMVQFPWCKCTLFLCFQRRMDGTGGSYHNSIEKALRTLTWRGERLFLLGCCSFSVSFHILF